MADPTVHSEDLAGWQTRQLPLMVKMIVGLTLFFFTASLGQLLYLHWTVREAPAPQIEQAYLRLSTDETITYEERIEAFRHESLARLEVYAINRQYHQANVLLMSRTWTRYLGFVTGMILALVGSVFILGKLQGPESSFAAEGGSAKYSLTSASPGVFLAGLGVALMITTIITHHEITTEHRPVYTQDFLDETPDDGADETLGMPPLSRPVQPADTAASSP